MNLSSLSIRRPVATIMILLMVVVLGFFAVVSIPMDLMPEIEMPLALVLTYYYNSSPEEVETMVTVPIESALASVEGLENILSYSMEGMSIVAVQFNLDRDMNFASLDMREKVALISDYLPEDASEPMVLKMDMNALPAVQLYISSDEMSLVELNNKIENNIVPYFERANGVASVSVSGGMKDEVALEFDQEELSTYGLSLSSIAQLLAAENINMPAGDIDKGDAKVIVRTIGEFESIDDIKNLPITISDRSIVRLGDIASVSMHQQDPTEISRVDGSQAIGVMISKQSDANSVDTSKAVGRVISNLEQKYPEMTFTVGYDSADYILSAIKSVATSALIGALLAVVVVFLFLRNLRTTAIIAISIPASLLAALAAMNALGITLNIVTLCALTVIVGMLVDNSIVALENIFRTRQRIPDAVEAASVGSKEIFLAIIASTLTTVVVFLPIALSDGMASIIFGDFCWTVIIALLASLIVAITVIPMLCSKVMRGTVSTDYIRIGNSRYKYKLLPKFGRFIENVTESYGRGVARAIKMKGKFVIAFVLIFVLSLGLVLTLGVELLPEADEGMISVSVGFPYGTSLEDKDKVLTEVESYALDIPELEHASMTTGSLSTLSMSDNASLTLILTDRTKRTRSATDIADALRSDLSHITEADIQTESYSSIMSMFGTNDISFIIKGREYDTLTDIGYELIDMIETLDCVDSADLDVSEGSAEVRVKIDRTVAAYYGITAYQLASGLSNALGGSSATTLNVDGTDIEVNLAYKGNVTSSLEDMKQVTITGSYGMSVPVGQIATFETANAPSVIQREGQMNYITLNVNVNNNSTTGGSSDVVALVESYNFPDGYFVEESGLYQQIVDNFTDLGKALAAAIALVFLLLAAQFESVIMSFVVMMAVPFAMTGAFIALFLSGTALSLTALLGLIILVGIVVNNSILLVEFINQNKEALGTHEALIQAGKLRLRPILMSCTTTVVGMIPLSLGLGDGGELMAPMAISIMGGLIASTVVTLFIIPVIYSMIDDRKNRKALEAEEKAARIKSLEAKWAEEDA